TDAGLIDESRRLHRVVVLADRATLGDASQFRMYQRDQRVQGRWIAVPQPIEQTSDRFPGCSRPERPLHLFKICILAAAVQSNEWSRLLRSAPPVMWSSA